MIWVGDKIYSSTDIGKKCYDNQQRPQAELILAEFTLGRAAARQYSGQPKYKYQNSRLDQENQEQIDLRHIRGVRLAGTNKIISQEIFVG
jgi:hypothetical protein